eukprot:gene13158-14507_t
MQEDKSYASKWTFFKQMEFLKEEVFNNLQSKEDKEWTDDEVETIADFYKGNQYLWNHHLSEYRDRDKKEIAMRKLENQLPNRSSEDIKSQWHKLKTIFDREDKRVEGSKRSGAGTDSNFESGDFVAWLRNFECCASANGWKDEDKLKKLPAFLKGPAAAHFHGLVAEQKESYATLSAHLKKALCPV